MKQVFYLASPEKLSRFDGLFQELDVVVQPQDMEKVKSLVTFIQREKTIHHMDAVILDLTDCAYSQEHILGAVQLLRRFSAAEPIFIAPSGEETSLLYGRLAAFRVSGLITADGQTDLQEELRACLLDDGGSFHRRAAAMQSGLAATAIREAAPLRIPPGLTLRVAVAGTQSRMGVTTQCFALFHYLKSLGFRPAILDEEQRLLNLLAPLYEEELEERDGCTFLRGIPFCTQISAGLDAYLLDLGVLSPRNAAYFSGQDLSVLVAGAKPWELPSLAGALKLLGDQPQRLATLVSFATQRDMEPLSSYLGKHAAIAAWHPDLWAAGSPATYQAAILPCLQALCGGGGG